MAANERRGGEGEFLVKTDFYEFLINSLQGPIARRPHDVKDCRNLSDAERFRREIVRDASKKITAIQNPGLGEFKLRDLNDEINRLIKLKHAWEQRIRELGGTDYR